MTRADLIFPGRISYDHALQMQNDLVGDLLAARGTEKLVLLEHEPVYTMGRRRDHSSLGNAELPHQVVETNRGGQATYHGPGQLVGYPILNLDQRGRDLHRYLRFLEEFLITLCRDHGVVAQRREGLTGVWVEDRKIASLGVGVRKWVSMHGFALNVNRESLEPFSKITPCGLVGVQMTCLAQECGRDLPFEEFSQRAADLFLKTLPDGAF